MSIKTISMDFFLNKIFPFIGWDYKKLIEQLKIAIEDNKPFTIHVRYATLRIPKSQVKKYLEEADKFYEEGDELDKILQEDVAVVPGKTKPRKPGPLKKEQIVAKYSRPTSRLSAKAKK